MDEPNRKIISQLEIDGRTSFKTLGRSIGYSSMGAKKRVEKLLQEKAVRISAQMNVKHFNMCSAVVLIEMEGPEDMRRLLKRFEQCPRVIYIFTTIGGYNIIALVVAENKDTLESISTEKCSLRSEKGIRRSEFYPVSEVYYQPFLPVRKHLTHKGSMVTPCNVNCVSCERYESRECVGCPATVHYRGKL